MQPFQFFGARLVAPAADAEKGARQRSQRYFGGGRGHRQDVDARVTGGMHSTAPSQQRGRGMLQGDARPPHSMGDRRQRRFRNPRCRQLRKRRPQPRAQIRRITVGRIVDPVLPAGREHRPEPGRRHREQRSHQPRRRRLGYRGHCRQTVDAAAAPQPHQHRFRLIAQMVTEQQVENAGLPTPPAQQPITLGARRRLHPGGRLSAVPAQHAMVDAQRRHPPAHFHGFRRRAGSEAVVDGDRRHPAATAPRPAVGQKAQGHAVGAAGHRHRHVRRRFKRAHGRHRGVEFLGRERIVAAHRDTDAICTRAAGAPCQPCP